MLLPVKVYENASHICADKNSEVFVTSLEQKLELFLTKKNKNVKYGFKKVDAVANLLFIYNPKHNKLTEYFGPVGFEYTVLCYGVETHGYGIIDTWFTYGGILLVLTICVVVMKKFFRKLKLKVSS